MNSMVRILAAELMVLGTMCYIMHPKSICAKGIWLSSIPAACAIVQATIDCSKLSQRICTVCVAIFAIWMILGAVQTFCKTRKKGRTKE